MAMSQTESYFEYCFLEEPMIFLNDTSRKKAFSSIKTKPTKILPQKLAKRNSHSFLLSIWQITFSNICTLVRDNRMIIELNWLCKQMKKGQKQPSSSSCYELSKTQFFPVNIVKYQCTYIQGSMDSPWIRCRETNLLILRYKN